MSSFLLEAASDSLGQSSLERTPLSNDSPRVLLVSMRELDDLVAYCSGYEFEDTIYGLAAVDMLKASSHYEAITARKLYKTIRNLSKSNFVADLAVPCLEPLFLEQEYDLFIPVFHAPFDLFTLRALKNWREKSKKAVCYIGEIWDSFIGNGNQYLLDFLKDFDHIFMSADSYVDKVAALTGRPCSHLSMGVDTLRFCPYSPSTYRSIDVCNIGRRSAITHHALLDLANKNDFFYYYDTFKSSTGVKNASKQQTFRVTSAHEHRLLVANILKRSRYFIANRGRINEPDQTRGKHAMSARFYEGAAAGAVMLGSPPNSDIFKQDFNWSDAVIKMDFDEPNIRKILFDLDAQPDRLEAARRNNVVNSLLRHDWVYRLKTIFETIGLQPTPQMQAREARLADLARCVQQMT
jgi:hypothetical protein